MEGLLIAEVLRDLAPRLPAERASFRFLDEDTVVLPLLGGPSLWIFVRPPHPRIELRSGAAPSGDGTPTRFQELLVARAGGPLVAAEQRKLDRVVTLRFGAGEGFVASEPADLIVELTGRNCNLILTDPQGTILGAAREVGADINRYRQIRPGLAYTPPPPYEKLDPRHASREAVGEGLEGKKLKNLRKVVDGVGPDLTEAVARLASRPLDASVDAEHLPAVLDALVRLVEAPRATMEAALERPDVETLRDRERRAALRERAETLVDKRIELVRKRIGDAERTQAAGAEAGELRTEADVLMAYAHTVPDHAESVTLQGFDGDDLRLDLDPRRDARGNAEERYRKAKKREQRAVRARQRQAELEGELREWRARRAELDALDDEALEALIEELAPTKRRAARREPGVRYRGPHGFRVVVGRSARENDEVTFKVARSRDVWLHVQGYHGAHVVVLAENREVPFDTIIYAAKLAAAYSKAAGGENVAVDYTQRKNVWKVKGMPAGAVHFTQQKTVYVTPDRHPSGGEVVSS